MARRKRNMLEAFQASKAEDTRESDPAPRSGAREAGGPFAAGEKKGERPLPAAARPREDRGPRSEPAERERERDAPAAPSPDRHGTRSASDSAEAGAASAGALLTLPRRFAGPLALCQILLLALAFWAGRASVGDVAAAGPDGPESGSTAAGAAAQVAGPDTGPRAGSAGLGDGVLGVRPGADGSGPPRAAAPPSASPGPARPSGPADERFTDPANRFTVAAIEYPNTAYWQERVWQVYDHLARADVPAVRPILKGDSIFLCVGAEPTMEGRLTALRERVRGLAGPDPATDPRPFADAYFRNIDDLIRR